MVPNKLDRLDVEEGDLLHFITWGGGGWGDPLERDPALVAKEIRQGLVSADGAKAYGVVADAEGRLDQAATERLRGQMRDAGGDQPLFDRGGTLDELRARCRDETGLEPPRPPVWVAA